MIKASLLLLNIENIETKMRAITKSYVWILISIFLISIVTGLTLEEFKNNLNQDAINTAKELIANRKDDEAKQLLKNFFMDGEAKYNQLKGEINNADRNGGFHIPGGNWTIGGGILGIGIGVILFFMFRHRRRVREHDTPPGDSGNSGDSEFSSFDDIFDEGAQQQASAGAEEPPSEGTENEEPPHQSGGEGRSTRRDDEYENFSSAYEQL